MTLQTGRHQGETERVCPQVETRGSRQKVTTEVQRSQRETERARPEGETKRSGQKATWRESRRGKKGPKELAKVGKEREERSSGERRHPRCDQHETGISEIEKASFERMPFGFVIY